MRHTLCFLIFVAVFPARAQGTPPSEADNGIQQSAPQQSPPDGQPGSLKRLPRNIGHDQKRAWTFPINLVRGEHWKPVLGLAATTAALVALDPHDTPYFRRTGTFTDFNKTFSSRNTGLGIGLFPAGFYVLALAKGDSYAQDSGILSLRALADAEIVSEIIKNVSRRRRPLEIPSNGDFSNTWFKAGGGLLINRGAFVSGHTMGAFAIADIFAERYCHHRWVPWAAYGLAGVVAFSRISNQNHFPSDVFAGAAFGFSISHFLVLRSQ